MNDIQIRLSQLKGTNFRHYLLSILLGTFGGGLSYITLTWAVTRDHGGILSVVILMLCFWLPSVFLGPLAGVIIDRFHITSKVMSASLGIRALIYLIVFGICSTGIITISDDLIYPIALVSGACLTIYGTAAMRYIREIIPHKDLIYANTTVDIAYEIGNVAGMSLSGLIIAIFTLHGSFGVIGGIFAIASLSLMLLKPGNIKSKPEISNGFFRDILDCWHYMKKNTNLLKVAAIQFILLVALMVAPVLLAPFARQILHTTVGEFGDIEAALSVGIILGGLIVPTLAQKFGFKKVLFIQFVILGLGFILFSYNRNIPLAALIYFVVGLSLSGWPLLVTEVQNNTELKYQGRISGMLNSLTALGILVMYGFVELISKYMSLPEIFYVEVVAVVVCLLILLGYKREG